jgi:hypothetical protein
MARIEDERPAPAAKRPVPMKTGQRERQPCVFVACVHAARFSLERGLPRRRTSIRMQLSNG